VTGASRSVTRKEEDRAHDPGEGRGCDDYRRTHRHGHGHHAAKRPQTKHGKHEHHRDRDRDRHEYRDGKWGRDGDRRRTDTDRLPDQQDRTKSVVVSSVDADSRTDRDKTRNGDRKVHRYKDRHKDRDRSEREQVSFEQYQSWMLAGIDRTLTWLTTIEQRFAQRGMDGKAGWIQRKQQALTELRGQVEAATSAEEIRAAVRETRQQVGTVHGLGLGHAKTNQPS
jgi:hypothetical protein